MKPVRWRTVGTGLLCLVLSIGLGSFPEFEIFSTAIAGEPTNATVTPGVELAVAQQVPGGGAYSEKGSATCLECHSDDHSVMAIFNTPHSQMSDRRTPFATRGCESCHGPSRAHSEDPGTYSAAVIFSKKDPESVKAQNNVCMDCHKGGLRLHWQGSQHQLGDVSCASCHNLHATRDKVMIKTSEHEVCITCHTKQRAEMSRYSRHPIREGKVTCSQCHNPHGSFGPTQLRKASVNETCYQCHAEKRGPFLWEHAPVTDSCANCHNPHGATQPRLLKARGPFLCQQCHLANYHPSTLYSGTGLPSNSPGSRLLSKNCLNCHPTIHGSNHPSGAAFTR